MKIIEAKNKLLKQLETVDENEVVAELSGEDAYGRTSYTAKEIKEFIETHDERGYDMMDTILNLNNEIITSRLFDELKNILTDVFEVSEREYQLIRRDLVNKYVKLKNTANL